MQRFRWILRRWSLAHGTRLSPSTGTGLKLKYHVVTEYVGRLQGDSHRLHGERKLKFYPCGLSLAAGNVNAAGQKAFYLVVVGSNRKLGLYSSDGLLLSEVTTSDDTSWRWACDCHLDSNKVLIGKKATNTLYVVLVIFGYARFGSRRSGDGADALQRCPLPSSRPLCISREPH